MAGVIIAVLVLSFVVYQLVFYALKRRRKRLSISPFPEEWRTTLNDTVSFYQRLNAKERERFEGDMLSFLDTVTLEGVSTTIEEKDKVLIAAGAIIPLFYLGENSYPNLDTVVLYPTRFDHGHKIEGIGRSILGMVGSGGYANRTMFLSRKSLYQGFRAEGDQRNTAIHEFIHLIDGWDGSIDGIPEVILDQPATVPWIHHMQQEMTAIAENDSDIRKYGATSQEEFLSVVGEYYFERPKKLQNEHPELFALLEQMFRPSK